MTNYFESREDVAGFVYDLALHSKLDFPSIMTIRPEKSGGFSVRIVTAASLGVTGENSGVLKFSDEHHNT